MKNPVSFATNRIYVCSFLGISGRVTMDENGDPEPDFALWFNGPDTEEIIHCISLEMVPETNTIVILKQKYWFKKFLLLYHFNKHLSSTVYLGSYKIAKLVE